MKRILGIVLAGVLLGMVQPVSAADIRVMTQNQYLGADLTPVFTAASQAAFNEAAVAALQQVAATQPAKRVKALAAEIAKERPALVGLQEVDLFQCTNIPPPTAGLGCDDASIRGAFVDHLQGTLSALGGTYVAAAIVMNLSVGVPLSINGFPVLVVAVDRDVILARRDVSASPVDFTGVCAKLSAQGCNYRVVLPITLPFTPPITINVERGFVAVDATVEGKAYRFVNTHLEEKHPTMPDLSLIQSYQAAELIQILGATTPSDRSLLVVGDTNSSPEDPRILGSVPTPYQQFLGTSLTGTQTPPFTDTWLLRPGKVPGLTCCQLADLSNHNSVLYERVDMLFSLEPPARVKQARVVGATVSDKTPPPGLGLWPSDHGAVSGELQFE
jgi:hypothetical protein